MNLRLSKPNPGASREEIQNLEEAIGLSLPPGYVEFLATHDGGLLADEENVLVPADENCPLKEIPLNSFFGSKRHTEQERSIVEILEECADLLPMTAIPIALGEFGEFLILDCESGMVELFVLRPTAVGTWGDYPTGLTIDQLARGVRI